MKKSISSLNLYKVGVSALSLLAYSSAILTPNFAVANSQSQMEAFSFVDVPSTQHHLAPDLKEGFEHTKHIGTHHYSDLSSSHPVKKPLHHVIDMPEFTVVEEDTQETPLSLPTPVATPEKPAHVAIDMSELEVEKDSPNGSPVSPNFDIEAQEDYLETVNRQISANPNDLLKVLLENRVPFHDATDLIYKHAPQLHRALHDAGVIDADFLYKKSLLRKGTEALLDVALFAFIFHPSFKISVRDTVLVQYLQPGFKYIGETISSKFIEQFFPAESTSSWFTKVFSSTTEVITSTLIKGYLYSYLEVAAETIADWGGLKAYSFGKWVFGQVYDKVSSITSPISSWLSNLWSSKPDLSAPRKTMPLETLWEKMIDEQSPLSEAEMKIYNLSPKAHWTLDQFGFISDETKANRFWKSYAWQGMKLFGFLGTEAVAVATFVPGLSIGARMASNYLIGRFVAPTVDWVVERFIVKPAQNLPIGQIIEQTETYAVYAGLINPRTYITGSIGNVPNVDQLGLLRDAATAYYDQVGITASDGLIIQATNHLGGGGVSNKVSAGVDAVVYEPPKTTPRRSPRLAGKVPTIKRYDPATGTIGTFTLVPDGKDFKSVPLPE